MMIRIKAALVHFSLSLLIFSLVMWLLVLRWYPIPFFWADGAWMGVLIAASVDVVLGPLLTLIIYKPGKKHLKLDLSLIALVQITALVWGCYNIYQVRPVFVVYGKIGQQGELTSVLADQILQRQGNPVDLNTLAQNNPYRPPLIFADLPSDRKELYKFLISNIYYKRSDLYLPYNDSRMDAALNTGLPREFFDKLEGTYKQEFDQFMAKHDRRFDDFAFLPLHCHFQSLVLIFERKSRSMVDYLALPIAADNASLESQ